MKLESIKIKVFYKIKLDDLYNFIGLCNIILIVLCLEFLEVNCKLNYGEFEDEFYEYVLS